MVAGQYLIGQSAVDLLDPTASETSRLIARLVRCARSSHITIRITGVGDITHPFDVLTLDTGHTVVKIPATDSVLYLEHPTDIERFRHHIEAIEQGAATAEESLTILDNLTTKPQPHSTAEHVPAQVNTHTPPP
ncbi:hypothetical protein GCM10010483_19580 [Actinokineospora diospyrosa]